ncbi:MAG TPA: hypothetical protein DG942_03205 [Ruminococcaceae bacterium]|nr:hypothetical protein [Oscillospiraceae bacterium]
MENYQWQTAQPPYACPTLPPELKGKTERRTLRKASNHAFLMPLLLTLFSVIIAGIAGGVWGFIHDREIAQLVEAGGIKAVQDFLFSHRDQLVLLLIPATAAAVLVTILSCKPIMRRKIFGAWRKPYMHASDFFLWAVIMFGGSTIGSSIVDALRAAFSPLGFHTQQPDFSLTGNQGADIVLILYVCLIGPVLEETLFRGMILQSLRPWGDWFAVIVSSIIFGLSHMNIAQCIPVIMIGIVLGFAAVKTESVFPSMLLHIINNTAAIVITVSGAETNQAANKVLEAAGIALAAAAVLLVILRREDVRHVIARHQHLPPEKHKYRVTFLQSVSFWILAAAFVYFCFAANKSASAVSI